MVDERGTRSDRSRGPEQVAGQRGPLERDGQRLGGRVKEAGRVREGVADAPAQQGNLGIIHGMILRVELGGPGVVGGAQQRVLRADAMAGAQRVGGGGVQPFREVLPALVPCRLVPVGDLPCGDEHFPEIRATRTGTSRRSPCVPRQAGFEAACTCQAVMPSCAAMTWTSELSQYSASSPPSMRSMSVPVKSTGLPGAAVPPGIPPAYWPWRCQRPQSRVAVDDGSDLDGEDRFAECLAQQGDPVGHAGRALDGSTVNADQRRVNGEAGSQDLLGLRQVSVPQSDPALPQGQGRCRGW